MVNTIVFEFLKLQGLNAMLEIEIFDNSVQKFFLHRYRGTIEKLNLGPLSICKTKMFKFTIIQRLN